MMGRTPGESFGNAFMFGGQAMGERRKDSVTRAGLAKLGLGEAEIDAAIANPAILNHYLKQASSKAGYGQDAPSSVREWEYYNQLSKDDQGRYLRMKRANPYLDIGTGYVQPDPTSPGEYSGGPIVKENYQERFDQAEGAAAGKAKGEADASYQSIMSKMPGLENVVIQLDQLADRATYTLGGQAMDTARRQLGMEPTDAALARAQYIAIVDNQILPLLRDTFGAQFTVKEGETLRATLGDADKSPKEKQAALKAFIEQKRRDVEALARQAGQSAPAPQAAPEVRRYRFNPETGELE